MASSDQVASIDSWTQIKPGFLDPWFADFLSGGADASFADNPEAISPIPSTRYDAAPTPLASSVSASSDPDSAPTRRPNPIPIAPRGKTTKKKSRASKRSQTTFISADPANFRQMVQQVTGVRLPGHHSTVLKPEPHRAAGAAALAMGGCFVPNLDASMMWRQNNRGRDAGDTFGRLVTAPAAADGGMAGVVSFDSIGGFPTLESWKAI